VSEVPRVGGDVNVGTNVVVRVGDGEERRPGWREIWDAGGGGELRPRIGWFEAERAKLLAFLR